MTCHVLHAGDGYTYLTEQVATGDVERDPGDEITAYYQREGNPPGQWVGRGCGELGVSGEVTEAQMQALFGEGLHPDADVRIGQRLADGEAIAEAIAAERLGRRFRQYDKQVPLVGEITAAVQRFEAENQRRPTMPERRAIKERTAYALLVAEAPERPEPTAAEVRQYLRNELGKARQPVAGFDLVFTPVKGVSLLWGLGDHELRAAVERLHEQAWQEALEFLEAEGAFTRAGTNGIAQLDTHGLIATAYQHRDSRAGDPNLHTHVTVSNRVLGQDGVWRTLDSRQLHRIAVTASEVYNSRIEDKITRELGVPFEEVAKGDDKRPVREVSGLPQEWLRGFSRRREQVEVGFDQLVADYVRAHGRTPPRTVQMQLAQQATLETRPGKEGRLPSMGELVAQWHERAQMLRPDLDVAETVGSVVHRDQQDPPAATHVAEVDVAALAGQVVETVAEHRSTWTQYHLRAEVERQVRGLQADSPQQRQDLVEQVTTRARDVESLSLEVEPEPVPELLQRRDGQTVFRRHGMGLLSSEKVLAAEDRLVQAGQTERGPTVDAPVRAAVLHQLGQRSGITLNRGQRRLVEHFTGCGKALAVGIGPQGTGKSTAMAAVREVWETTGGRVLGLAPSAAAAAVLSEEIGARAETMQLLTWQWRHGGEVDVAPGDLLLVDEAGMSGTAQLDTLREIAEDRGAVLRLLGDHRQLPAPESGGALRLLVHEIGGVELTDIRRFHDEEEARAVRRVRLGMTSAVDWYAQHHRLHGGVRPAVLEALYRDWQADLADGVTSIMISDDPEAVRELGARAQTELRAAGLVENSGVALHDETVAGIGDQVVTRRNRRDLRVNRGRDFVKNGDLWRVQSRDEHGRLQVRHRQHGGHTWLEADYVAAFVELGYARTDRRSQGMTVDRARMHLSPSATRQSATVGLSRGRWENHAYLETEATLSADEPQVMDGDLFYGYRSRSSDAEALAAVLGRDGAEVSATEQLREAQQAPFRFDEQVPAYDYARQLHRGDDEQQRQAEAEQWVQQAVPEWAASILADEAWPALHALLRDVAESGSDPAELLAACAGERELDTAESVAQVLHYRVCGAMPEPAPSPERPAQLPGWIVSPPSPELDEDRSQAEADLGDWVRTRAQALAERVEFLGQQVAQQRPPWSSALGDVPEDPLERDRWQLRAGQVAAYREWAEVSDGDTSLLGPAERGRAGCAQDWVQRYLALPDPRAIEQSSPEAEGQTGSDEPLEQQQEEVSAQTGEAVLAAARRFAAEHSEPAAAAAPARIPAPGVDADVDQAAEINAAAAAYYTAQLAQTSRAQHYLQSRLPDVDAARARFTLGYAPPGWRGLVDHLRDLGYDDQALLDAGVASTSRTGGLIDRFRDRLMLGWHDEHGRLAGFTGRDLSGTHPAKYLNTPATALFDKSELVFGVHEQRQSLAAGATPVVVEGAFDVLALHTADPQRRDIAPVTASGTAVTARHLDTLQRTATSEQLVIGLDQDAAGQAAAARTVDRAVQRWRDTRVVTLPEGYDPADWVASHEQPEQALPPYTDRQQQQPAAGWLAEQAVATYFAGSRPEHRHEVEGQLEAARAAAAALAHVERSEAIQAGLDVAQQLELVEASHMASLLADARAQQHSAGGQREQGQRSQPAAGAALAAPETSGHEAGQQGRSRELSSLAERARAVREHAAQRTAAAEVQQQQQGTGGRSPARPGCEREDEQRAAEAEEQHRREQQRADEERQRQERERAAEQQRQADQQRDTGLER
jgi:DNA primase catalytic core